MRSTNVQMFEETLDILKKRKYTKDGKKIRMKLSGKQMKKCSVYLPEDIQSMTKPTKLLPVPETECLEISCKNTDSFSMALEKHALGLDSEKNILVLNFANPFNPGGGVRDGAHAQEEDLCRKSSLFLSLDSKEAIRYYVHNLSLQTYLSSDAIILTPDVEIIRNENGELLDETAVVSVMTCAAPIVTPNLEGLTKEQYAELLYQRICGMLKCAAFAGYRVLVLGAWGCGAFGNDAKLVSDLFCKAIREFTPDGIPVRRFFRRIDFAVLDRTREQYNFGEFMRNFSNEANGV